MNLMPIPALTENEFHTILAGLDQLPGRISRVLHNKLTEHANVQIAQWKMEEAREKLAIEACCEQSKP